ncbi:hypothetical protein B0H67DRAFT_482084 [Lasiosphaeris hirsuta]|uniref:Uncharacterized protein n=1 Tax=Lasiosphaeris hirsuta TaxID=260670 RepID=A0AA40E7I7_9PEZI|nr:hypothetical protein B0H67DRAFT_482084 [Lasiosphaeris hirsuta]
MAPTKKPRVRSSTKDTSPTALQKPFQPAPVSLAPFYTSLSKKHVYIVHIDPRPVAFKRKIFLVPSVMNIFIALLFVWRAWYILPYYLELLASTLGYPNATTLRAADLSYGELIGVILRRGFTFLLDFVLVVFVWPWPAEFVIGGTTTSGSPVGWRWAVGFREREVYVRRSRKWDREIGDVATAAAEGTGNRAEFWERVRTATTPMLLQQKTGYLLMDGFWDLDWNAMVLATKLADDKIFSLDELETVVLLYSKQHGWVCIDQSEGVSAKEDERRKQVFAFRDALASMGKEDLFFRWIEIVQYETSQPGGFGGEKQVAVAEQIRELFRAGGVDFDKVWGEVIGGPI